MNDITVSGFSGDFNELSAMSKTGIINAFFNSYILTNSFIGQYMTILSYQKVITGTNSAMVSFLIYITSSYGSTWSLFANYCNYSSNPVGYSAGSVSMSESGKYILYGSFVQFEEGEAITSQSTIYISSTYGSSWYLISSSIHFYFINFLYLGQLHIVLI